jgi:hypothetical protein
MIDFVEIVEKLTGFIQNERVAAYNEGVDEMINAIRGWMFFEGVRLTSAENIHNESVPDMLNEIKEHYAVSSPQGKTL